MGNPIQNLKDYNIPRNLLKAAGGNWNTVYNNIGKTAVAKATPKILLKGGAIGAGTIGLLWTGCEVVRFMKDRKQLIENEPTLKKSFIEAVELDPTTECDDTLIDCDQNSEKE